MPKNFLLLHLLRCSKVKGRIIDRGETTTSVPYREDAYPENAGTQKCAEYYGQQGDEIDKDCNRELSRDD
jgi:hypothetical protein